MALIVNNIFPRLYPASRILSCLLLCISASLHAGYKDDIGFRKLEAEQGINTPDGSGVPVTQVEAAESMVGNDPVYLPDLSDSEFSGTTITVQSGSAAGIFSSHATSIGRAFYGNASSIASGISLVDAFWVDHWLQDGFLRFGGMKPLVSSSHIANHSWVGDAEVSANAELLRRIDWVVATDEYIQCVGVINNASANQPLMSSAYNVIAVGKSDGLNGMGTVQLDAEYVTGRTRPELVAPTSITSSATAVVSASAALLIEYGQNNPGLSTDPVETSTLNRNGDTIYNTGRSEVVKAILMAGADRSTANTSAADIIDYRVATANQTANGLDSRFGAGQVNIYNSFHIAHASEQNSDEDIGTGTIGTYGFDYDPSFGGASGSNSAASYYFSTGANQKELSATLAWNIKIDGGNGPNFSGSAQLYDMDLNLYDITVSPVLLYSSSSTIDNTETIWVTLLAGRNYMLQVVPKPGQGAFNWDYALAWRMADLIDTDGDGIADINDLDDDDDGLSDTDEATYGTNPLVADTDGDGLSDGEEVGYDGDISQYTPGQDTNPLIADTDGDGLIDSMDPIPLTVNVGDGDLAPWDNPDGYINVADALIATQLVLGQRSAGTLQYAHGDINIDGVINLADLQLIQQAVLQ